MKIFKRNAKRTVALLTTLLFMSLLTFGTEAYPKSAKVHLDERSIQSSRVFSPGYLNIGVERTRSLKLKENKEGEKESFWEMLKRHILRAFAERLKEREHKPSDKNKPNLKKKKGTAWEKVKEKTAMQNLPKFEQGEPDADGEYSLISKRWDGQTKKVVHCDADDNVVYTLEYRYNILGKFKGTTQTLANGLIFERNAEWEVTKAKFPEEMKAEYKRPKDGETKVREHFDSQGNVYLTTTSHFDKAGNFTGRTYAYSNGYIYEYDGKWRHRKTIYPNGKCTVNQRFEDGRINFLSHYGKNGKVVYVIKYHFDEEKKPTGSTLIYANGYIYERDANYRTIKATHSNTSYTIYKRHEDGRTDMAYKYKAGEGYLHYTIKYHYDENKKFTGSTLTYANGCIYERDAKYRTLKVIYPDGRYTVYSRHEDGKYDLTTHYDKSGEMAYTIKYHYDDNKNLTGSILTYANGYSYERDAKYRTLKLIYPDGRCTVYSRHEDGRCDLTTHYGKDGEVIYTMKYHYDKHGRFNGTTLTYANGYIYRRDAKWRTVKMTYPDGSNTIYIRGTNGKCNVLIRNDAKGNMVYVRLYHYGLKGQFKGTIQIYATGRVYIRDAKYHIVKRFDIKNSSVIVKLSALLSKCVAKLWEIKGW